MTCTILFTGHRCYPSSLLAKVLLGVLPIAFSAVSQGKNLQFVQDAGDSSPSLREGHRGIFSVDELIAGGWDSRFTSIRGTAHTTMNHPTCETPGMISFIAGSTFKPRLDGLKTQCAHFYAVLPPPRGSLMSRMGFYRLPSSDMEVLKLTRLPESWNANPQY